MLQTNYYGSAEEQEMLAPGLQTSRSPKTHFNRSIFRREIKSETEKFSAPPPPRPAELLAIVKSKPPHVCQLWYESSKTVL